MLRRLGIGFLYGAGFAVGAFFVAILLMFASGTFFSQMFAEGQSFPAQRPDPPGSFTFSNTDAIRDKFDRLVIVGTVESPAVESGRYLNVYADLFDKSGAFLYQCWTQFKGGIVKGEKINFMIECSGAPDEIRKRYDSFKVYARRM